MASTIRRARERGRVVFRRAKVRQLLFGDARHQCVLGARLENGDVIRADLGTMVDLSGRVEARGQVMAYVSVTEPVEGVTKILRLRAENAAVNAECNVITRDSSIRIIATF